MIKRNIKFESDPEKDRLNQEKHHVSFAEAEEVFYDTNVFIETDADHSQNEQRYLAYGKTQRGIMTVRFTMREEVVRIFGAAYWRKGSKIYAKKSSV